MPAIRCRSTAQAGESRGQPSSIPFGKHLHSCITRKPTMAEDKRAYTVIGENDWNRWTRLMPSSPFSDRPEEYSERKVVWDARGELFIEILKAVSRDAVAAGKHPESITITVAH